MPRKPNPPDAKLCVFHFRAANLRYLEERRIETGRCFTEAINSELEFLRAWGLSGLMLRRLEAAAAAAQVTPLEYVQTLVMVEALHAPPMPPSLLRREPEATTAGKRTSLNLTGPNHQFVLEQIAEGTHDYNAAVNRLLDFSRTFGLNCSLRATLEAVAATHGVSLRDYVQTLIADRVARLGEAPTSRAARLVAAW